MQFTVNQRDLKELVKKLSYFRYTTYSDIFKVVEMYVTKDNVVFREATRSPQNTDEFSYDNVVYACELNNVKNIDADNDNFRQVWIPFDKLKQYVNATEKDSDVTITLWSRDNPWLVKYKTVSGTFSFNTTFQGADFPTHENVPEICRQMDKRKTTYTVNKDSVDYNVVASLLSYACNEKNKRKSLATINMIIDKNTITYQATDNYVLAELQQKINAPDEMKEPIQALVPVKVFSGLGHKEFNDYDKIIVTEDTDNGVGHITFAKDNYNYVLVHYNMEDCSQYPTFEYVIPKNNKTTVSFDKVALRTLISALKKCKVISYDNSSTKIVLDNSTQTLSISTTAKTKPDSFDYVLEDIKSMDLQGQEEYTANINAVYLLNTLNAVDFKNQEPCIYTISFDTNNNLRPLVITNTQVPEYVQVVTPIRV